MNWLIGGEASIDTVVGRSGRRRPLTLFITLSVDSASEETYEHQHEAKTHCVETHQLNSVQNPG